MGATVLVAIQQISAVGLHHAGLLPSIRQLARHLRQGPRPGNFAHVLKSQLPHQREVVTQIDAFGVGRPVGFAHQHRVKTVLIAQVTHKRRSIRRHGVVRVGGHAQLPRRKPRQPTGPRRNALGARGIATPDVPALTGHALEVRQLQPGLVQPVTPPLIHADQQPIAGTAALRHHRSTKAASNTQSSCSRVKVARSSTGDAPLCSALGNLSCA